MSVSAPLPYVYQSAPLVTDASTIKGQVINYVHAYMPPGWQLPAGSPLDLVIEAIAIQAAQQADVAQQKLDADFRYFGKLLNLPPIDALPAQSLATFTVTSSTAVQTIAAGDVVGITDPTGTLQGFALTADVVIAAGLTTGVGTVIAQEAGSVCNGLAGNAQLVQAEPFVTSAVLATALGGVDAELDSDYLNRLTETAGVFRVVPVLGSDFAVLARSIAGIYRACGANLLKPGPPYDSAAEATNVEKNVTVAVADIAGNSVGSTIRANGQAYLRGLREANFQIWVVDPQYVTVDVASVNAYAWPGWNTSAVHDAIVTAIQQFLSPALFATDPSGVAARWANDPVVHASGLYAAILQSSGGIRNIDPPSFGIRGAAMGTGDVTLGAGSAIPALPRAGTITVTVIPTTL